MNEQSQNGQVVHHNKKILHKQCSCELSPFDLASVGQKTVYSVIASGTKEQLNRSAGGGIKWTWKTLCRFSISQYKGSRFCQDGAQFSPPPPPPPPPLYPRLCRLSPITQPAFVKKFVNPACLPHVGCSASSHLRKQYREVELDSYDERLPKKGQ